MFRRLRDLEEKTKVLDRHNELIKTQESIKSLFTHKTGLESYHENLIIRGITDS